jgi:hypothetical protein
MKTEKDIHLKYGVLYELLGVKMLYNEKGVNE